jgi:Uncharacterized protein conserved in bacteria
MATDIKCPNCGSTVDIEGAVTEEYKKRLRDQMTAYKKQKEDEFALREKELVQQVQHKETEFAKKLQEEKTRLQQSLEETLRKSITADFENQLRLLQQSNKSNEEKLAEARRKELEFLKKEQDLKNKEAELELAVQRKVQEERGKLAEEMQKQEVQLRKAISADFENKMRLLEQSNKDNEEKLVQARQKELEFLQKEQDLKNKEAELELSVQRKLQEERIRLSEEIRKLEEQKTAAKETEYQLRMRELEKQLEDQKKLAEEMRRKAEQGSTQLQGEVQELILEEMLRSAFPFDLVCEVGKGVRGADCILTIRNSVGQECGKIIFESKRTKHFDKNWIEKLKADMRSTAADVGVIVTQALPDQWEKFGQLEGIWICSFGEVQALVHVLRDGIIKIAAANRSQENKGDKMHMLYDYLTSNEFAEQWKAIREGFQAMKLSIQKERDAMEKLWKAREKQLEKVLLNAAHIKGSIEGIAGSDNIHLSLDDNDPLLLD